MAQLDKDALFLLEEGQASSNVLAQTIRWDTLQDASIIKPKDLELMQRYDKKNIETKIQLFNERGNEFASLFLNMISEFKAKDKLSYVLALVDELLTADESKALFFADIRDGKLPFTPLLRLLQDSDQFISSKAAKILSTLMIKSNDVAHEDLTTVLHWANDQLKRSGFSELYTALSTLQIILRKDQYRLIYAQDNGLHKLGDLLVPHGNYQILYQALYCIWLLSFNQKVAKEGFSQVKVIPRVVEVLRTATKDKVLRVGLAILRNLIDLCAENNEQMIEAGAIRVVESMSSKKWGDEDLVADLEVLREALQKNLALLSSFDIYKQELFSKSLEWTPVHKSEKFWRENAHHFEDNNCRALSALINVLKDNNSSPVALAVACYDLGEFVRFYPKGRALLQDLSAKQYIMGLMSHPEPEVQKHALLSIQKIMVQNWEYLSR